MNYHKIAKLNLVLSLINYLVFLFLHSAFYAGIAFLCIASAVIAEFEHIKQIKKGL